MLIQQVSTAQECTSYRGRPTALPGAKYKLDGTKLLAIENPQYVTCISDVFEPEWTVRILDRLPSTTWGTTLKSRIKI